MSKRRFAAALLAALILSPVVLVAQTPVPETDAQKTLYALGMLISSNLAPFSLTADEVAMVQAGMTDSLLGRDNHSIDPTAFQQQLQELAQSRAAQAAQAEKGEAQAFLDKEAAMAGATKTESGLIYTVLAEGTGETPAATDRVTVHYHGTLRDGTVFDSSRDRGEPVTFGLNQVIACWTEGVTKMKVGGKSKLVCPAAIAYGDRGAPGGVIKPGAALAFEVELISIEEAQ